MNPDEENAPPATGHSPEGPKAPQGASEFRLDSELPPPPLPPAPEGPKKDVSGKDAKRGPGRPPGKPKKGQPVRAKRPAPEPALPKWTPPGASPTPETPQDATPGTSPASDPGTATVEASDLDKGAFRCARATVTLYCLVNTIWLREDFEISDKEKADLQEASQDFFRTYPGVTLFPLFALALEFGAHFARLLQKPAVRLRFFALMRWIRGEKQTPPPAPHAAP